MAENDTLLAHLAPSLTGRTEDIAVTALGYILNRSDAAKEGLDSVVQSGVKNVSSVARVRTQAIGRDWSRPDLVGIDYDGTERVLIEAKFWAELTGQQPNAYLRRLPKSGPSVLLFVAPGRRIETLWPQLRTLAESAGNRLSDVDAERRCMRVNDSERHLMVLSWSSLLDAMAARTVDAGDSDIAADIRQLRGLAEFADEGAFIPLNDNDQKSGSGSDQRVHDLQRIVNDAIDHGVEEGWADKRGLSVSRRSARYPYGRYFRIGDAPREFWLGVNSALWDREGAPLWLHFFSDNSRLCDEIRGQLPVESFGGWVPIHLKPGVEYKEVYDHAVSQLTRISDLIRAAVQPVEPQ